MKNRLQMSEVVIQLHPADPVGVAKIDLEPGIELETNQGIITVQQAIPSGHKLALEAIVTGQAVKRYGQVIGFASQLIQAGEHVHKHNLGLQAPPGWQGWETHPSPSAAWSQPGTGQSKPARTFLGYRRADGRAGTRNYIAVISTVNCSAHATRQIAHHFTPERLSAYPNVSGVIALTHPYGCSIEQGGDSHVLLQRTLAGMVRHPNIGASLLVGLGCEVNQASEMLRNYHLECPALIIQELGGIHKTVTAGIALVESLLPVVNATQREPRPVAELAVALQCGGSDGWSGVTANPVVGLAADELVRQGGTVLLAETPEIYGAEHLLISRAKDTETARQLLAQVRWWEEHTRRMGITIDDNRSPGNEAGGLTTIYEKALGAVSKGGSSPLTGVYAYGETVSQPGLGFMNTPGNDAAAVTGQVAGGCNLVLFTTGRGSVFGFKPAPSIKISTNTRLYERMSDDIDLDAGRILSGESLQQVAAELFELILAVASGEPSKSEAQGVGEAEFSPWFLGGML